jgi:hypothetical protein
MMDLLPLQIIIKLHLCGSAIVHVGSENFLHQYGPLNFLRTCQVLLLQACQCKASLWERPVAGLQASSLPATKRLQAYLQLKASQTSLSAKQERIHGHWVQCVYVASAKQGRQPSSSTTARVECGASVWHPPESTNTRRQCAHQTQRHRCEVDNISHAFLLWPISSDRIQNITVTHLI